MQNFMEWEIKNSLCLDAELYFVENTMIGLRQETEMKALPGQTVYKVTDHDEADNTIVLTDTDGNRYKFDQDDLAKALSENSTMRGFQVLQYPIGYILAGSGTELSKLSIYDPRVKNIGSKTSNKKK